jgi:hypothetical protein
VAILSALMMSGVLIGFGAIVLDVGQMYAERAQVQNGADAAAFTIAGACSTVPVGAACASNPGSPGTTAYSAANTYAVHNANDGRAHISSVCGAGAASLPATCSGASAPRYCPSAPASGSNYVEVQTQTGVDSSNTLLPPVFGRALLGPSYTGTTVGACAQVGWGYPASLGNAAALTISKCEWLNNTDNGTTFAPVPGSSAPPSFLDTLGNRSFLNTNGATITFPDPNSESVGDGSPAPVAGSETLVGTHETNNCSAGHPGWAAPGEFGWLSNSSCAVSVTGPQYSGVTGNSAANCAQPFLASRTNQTPIYLPVYDSVDTATGKYVLDGFAAFIVTGWDFSSGQGGWDKSIAPVKVGSSISLADGTPAKDANYCGNVTGSPSDVCLYGFFTQKLIPASALPSGSGTSNLGAPVLRLSG